MIFRRWFNRLTLTQQWVTVTLIAVIPLLLALVYAGWVLAQQAQQQRELLASMDHLNNMNAFIQRQLASMERVSRQYMLIGDRRFAELYRNRLVSLADYQINLVVTLPSGREHSKLRQLLELASQIGGELYRPPEQMNAERIDGLWNQVNAGREELSTLIDQFGRESTAANERRLQQVHRQLGFIGGGTIIATLLLVTISSVAVTQPVRRLASSINRIGHQDWERAVRIEGPRDFIALGENLEWMRQQLSAADRQKQAFLHHITHELKTPLAAIMEAESLLRDQVPGPLTQQQFGVLGILRQNARSLQALIQQLLNYNAIKHSHAVDMGPVNIRELCDRIRRQLLQANPDKEVIYRIKGPEPRLGRNQFIDTDRQCIEMVLSNLLSNAHRCVQANGCITIDWARQGNQWWLSVADNGPGIPEQERENIFKPFFQGSQARKGPLKGSGMGLAIVRECVRRLNGELSLESSPGRSTIFTLRFPTGDQHYHEAA